MEEWENERSGERGNGRTGGTEKKRGRDRGRSEEWENRREGEVVGGENENGRAGEREIKRGRGRGSRDEWKNRGGGEKERSRQPMLGGSSAPDNPRGTTSSHLNDDNGIILENIIAC